MTEPLLTVIIPAYNCRPFIEAAVLSCFRQGLEALEVIVVNDGSTDGTEIELRNKISDPRLVVVDTTNQGVSAARNTGISHARGKYITFLDGDDEFGAGTFEENVGLLESSPGMSWLFFPIQRVNEHGQDVDEISGTLLPSFHYPAVEELSAAESFLGISRREMPVCGGGDLSS